MKHVGIITQARMTSSRLPKKVLLKIKNKTVLDYHINRLKASKINVFVATTTNETDDPIINFCQQNNLPFYRGSEENVLNRFYECAAKYQLDVIVRVTSDCPLIDGALIKKAVEQYLEQNNDRLYLSNALERTYPRGFDFEVFSFSLLKEAHEKATLQVDLEHVTPYIHQQRAEDVSFFHIKNETDESEYRITLDTEDDFKLIQTLIEVYEAEKMTYTEIINLFKKNPELKAINQHIEQKKI